ncbi:hypothetical protein EON65_31135 [archaeon]|nr:MAG: hypothetical protein EON65_31135 [archaeon]
MHEVISQLRQSRKQHSQTSEQTQQEIISLRAALSDTEKQLQGLRDKVAYYQDFEGKYGAILPSYTALQSGYDDVATRYTHCQAALQQREKELYTLQASFEALSADYKLALQQTQQQSLQMDNLHQALSSLEKEGKQDSLTYKHQLAELQREIGEYKQSLEKVKEYEHTIATLNAQLKEARQQSEDMVLKCRQLEYEYNRDRKTLQTKLEEVIAQYTNSVKKDHSDTIDRHIIANLVVSYFQRKRSKEVLELIAKVLCFDEQQLVDVGLRVNPNVSLLGTLWTSVVGGEVPGSNPVPVEVS